MTERERLPDVLFVSSNDWDHFWYQRQEFATRFARAGHRVFYFNRTLQRWPTLHHFKTRFLGAGRGTRPRNPRPEGLRVVTPLWLPPMRYLRFVNRRLIRRTAAPLGVESPVLIAGVPTYNTLDLIDRVRPVRVVYVNVHNYDGAVVVSHLRDAERELAQRADLLFADSEVNARRLEGLSGGRVVHRSPPGVDYAAFRRARRGDEAERRRTLYYYGGIGPHLDLELYGALAERLRVVFVGLVDPAVRGRVPANIEVRPPVTHRELPEALREADALGIFYRRSEYIRGVMPAKFFECAATGKPLLLAGVAEAEAWRDAVYVVDGSPDEVLALVEALAETETPERLGRRDALARDADWEARFRRFSGLVLGERRSGGAGAAKAGDFSVLMSVHGGADPERLDAALASLGDQTLPPDEVVLVKDGPLTPELDAVVEAHATAGPGRVRVVPLPENVGLGAALGRGMEHCSHELVARMDADDLCLPERFEAQHRHLTHNRDVDVVSCWTQAFDSHPDQVLFERRDPFLPEQLARLARFRSPVTHAACMYRRSAVLAAGGYCNWPRMQDYHLWARMFVNGSRFACIPRVLYKVHWDENLVRDRRGGWQRAARQVELQRLFLRIGFVSFPRFLFNVVARVAACLLPCRLMKYLRSKRGI